MGELPKVQQEPRDIGIRLELGFNDSRFSLGV